MHRKEILYKTIDVEDFPLEEISEEDRLKIERKRKENNRPSLFSYASLLFCETFFILISFFKKDALWFFYYNLFLFIFGFHFHVYIPGKLAGAKYGKIYERHKIVNREKETTEYYVDVAFSEDETKILSVPCSWSEYNLAFHDGTCLVFAYKVKIPHRMDYVGIIRNYDWNDDYSDTPEDE